MKRFHNTQIGRSKTIVSSNERRQNDATLTIRDRSRFDDDPKIEVGIENFRWHDLRHTWASWHVQNGTSLYDLKNLGGWAGMQMVERYAHMTHERVAKVAGNIDGIWQTSAKLRSDDEIPIAWNPTYLLAPRPGLEPGTCGLTVYRSI
jgi:Phage integrase family